MVIFCSGMPVGRAHFSLSGKPSRVLNNIFRVLKLVTSAVLPLPVSSSCSAPLSSNELCRLVNGNGYKFDGGGPFYWVRENMSLFLSDSPTQYDCKDGGGSTQKPQPMMRYPGDSHRSTFSGSDQVFLAYECLAHSRYLTPISNFS